MLYSTINATQPCPVEITASVYRYLLTHDLLAANWFLPFQVAAMMEANIPGADILCETNSQRIAVGLLLGWEPA